MHETNEIEKRGLKLLISTLETRHKVALQVLEENSLELTTRAGKIDVLEELVVKLQKENSINAEQMRSEVVELQRASEDSSSRLQEELRDKDAELTSLLCELSNMKGAYALLLTEKSELFHLNEALETKVGVARSKLSAQEVTLSYLSAQTAELGSTIARLAECESTLIAAQEQSQYLREKVAVFHEMINEYENSILVLQEKQQVEKCKYATNFSNVVNTQREESSKMEAKISRLRDSCVTSTALLEASLADNASLVTHFLTQFNPNLT